VWGACRACGGRADHAGWNKWVREGGGGGGRDVGWWRGGELYGRCSYEVVRGIRSGGGADVRTGATGLGLGRGMWQSRGRREFCLCGRGFPALARTGGDVEVELGLRAVPVVVPSGLSVPEMSLSSLDVRRICRRPLPLATVLRQSFLLGKCRLLRACFRVKVVGLALGCILSGAPKSPSTITVELRSQSFRPVPMELPKGFP
jgi:hypothetical protein